jgi:cytochrome c-type biogenesis protein CcmF
MNIAGYTLRFDGVKAAQGPNYDAARATVTVLSGGRILAVMHPEKRIFPAEQQDTVETAIRTTIVSDLYLALGDQRERGRWILRAYVNPLAPLIWLGALVMALGGFASLWNRLRIVRPSAIAATVPAE